MLSDETATSTVNPADTSTAAHRYIHVGLYYKTSDPANQNWQYIATQANTTTDVGTSTSADGESSVYKQITTDSFATYTAVLTLPDDAVFGSFFIRRAIRAKGYLGANSGTGSYVVTAGWSNEKYPVIKSISMQQSTGLSMGTFQTMFSGVSGISASTISTNWNISDKYLKENIQDLDGGLDIIQQLSPKKFTWRDFAARVEHREIEFNEDGEETLGNKVPNYGLIAQEAAKVLPELVVSNAYNATEIFEDDASGEITSEVVPYMGFDYTQLIPILVKAIQEQQTIIESQQNQIDDLKELVNKSIEDKGE